MAAWIEHLIETLGYPGVLLLMFLENVFPPIPSEIVMPYSGYVTTRSHLALWAVVAVGTAGAILGSLPIYYLGRWLGMERIVRWADRHGQWLLVSGREIERAGRFFDRHGGKAVFLARVLPGVRSLISIPAGVYRMNLWAFLLWTAVGTAIWAGLLAWLGALLGHDFGEVNRWAGPATYGVFGALVLWYIVAVVRRKRTQRSSD